MTIPDLAALIGENAALRDILAIAGPETTLRILQQVGIDFTSVQSRLIPALAVCDWASIRAETHVLMSVAGTIGATQLQHLAQSANHAAHARSTTEIEALATDLRVELARMIDMITTHLPAPKGGPA
jgi:HPt (histidine-containing phosphotransfer) domain-containing protein